MKFKKYLNEKTFNINKDVDFIYKNYFKKHIDLFKKGDGSEFVHDGEKVNWRYGNITSDKLPSKKAHDASLMNLVYIEMGVFDSSSYYEPFKKHIRLTLNKSAVNLLNTYKTIDAVKDLLKPSEYKRWYGEFGETGIKGTIYHELSHWMDDTFHNKHITNKLIKAKESGTRDALTNKGAVNLSIFELDAQVHAIKQLKRTYKKIWDDVTWEFIVQHKSSFDVVFMNLKNVSKKDKEDYIKRLYKRLNREKLLGKSLINGFEFFLRQY